MAHVRDTGALQRTSPLPLGTYWIDTFRTDAADRRAEFEAWASANSGVVKVLSRENFDSDPPRTWWLFKVTGGPTGQFLPTWDARRFGFPTIAEAGVTTSDDTVQKPDVQDMSLAELLGVTPGIASSLRTGAFILGGAIVAAIAVKHL